MISRAFHNRRFYEIASFYMQRYEFVFTTYDANEKYFVL